MENTASAACIDLWTRQTVIFTRLLDGRLLQSMFVAASSIPTSAMERVSLNMVARISAKQFVQSLCPSAKYNEYLGLVEADVKEINLPKGPCCHRTYWLGIGKNEKAAWIAAEDHLKQCVVRWLES